MEGAKYYFFRDLDHNANLDYGGSGFPSHYHAAGVVTDFFAHIGSPSDSGKDVCVISMNPFSGQVEQGWRAFEEIELMETSFYEYVDAVRVYDSIEKLQGQEQTYSESTLKQILSGCNQCLWSKYKDMTLSKEERDKALDSLIDYMKGVMFEERIIFLSNSIPTPH